jgi:hypothetical protein
LIRAGATMVLFATACGGPGSTVSGAWVGDFRAGMTLPLEITIDSTGRAGKVSLRPWGLEGAAAWGRTHGDSAEILVPTDRDTASFRGRLAGPTWNGSATRGTESVPFELRRLRTLTPIDWAAIIGTYRAQDGRLIGVARFTEFGNRPMLVDYRSGRVGPLLPIEDDRLLLGASIVAPLFPADTVTLERHSGATVSTLRLAESGQPAVVADRLPTRDEEVAFSNGPVSLAGTVTLPESTGSYPALVLVHGSNAQTRDAMGPWVRYFAGLGFAVLAYDKRGTGGSTGDWRQSDFATLAGDALSAVRALARRRDIRADRIGLWGISQAGWIMPLVVARAPAEIAFMIVHAGTGTTVREQGILNYRNELRFAGLSDSAVAIGVRYRLLDDAVTRTGEGLATLERYYQSHRAEAPWLEEPAPLDAWFRSYYRMLMDYDPKATWERLTCPVLLFFGELDANVPPRESWPPIERGLRRAGNTRVAEYVLPRANHVFLEARTGGRDEYPALRSFVPGYFDRMAEWLAANGR